MTEICKTCAQAPICQLVGRPIDTIELRRRRTEKRPINTNELACYYALCDEGVTAAIDKYLDVEKTNTLGLHPFKTGHKPFLDIEVKSLTGETFRLKGRYVVYGIEKWKNGDIIVIVNDQEYIIDNVYDLIVSRKRTSLRGNRL